MGIPNRGEGGARTPMQKCLWTYHRIVRFRKDILQMSQFWFTCTWLLSRCGIFHQPVYCFIALVNIETDFSNHNWNIWTENFCTSCKITTWFKLLEKYQPVHWTMPSKSKLTDESIAQLMRVWWLSRSRLLIAKLSMLDYLCRSPKSNHLLF